MKAADPVLSVVGLIKAYNGIGGVADVSFEVGEGDVVGLLGPNGSGKSTTLHCLTGIVRETAGSVAVCGIEHHLPDAKNLFGFLPDDLAMPESLRLGEVVTLHRRLRPEFDDELVDDLVGIVGLREHADKFVGQYSHGMKRKLQLVMALAHHPRLLILDEPMRGLDPEAGILVRTLIDTFREQGGGVLIATHDLAAAEGYCDRVVVLHDGQVVARGAPDELCARTGASSLEEFFVAVTGMADVIDELRSRIRRRRFVPRNAEQEEVVSENGTGRPATQARRSR